MTEYPAAEHFGVVRDTRDSVVEFITFLREQGVQVGRSEKVEHEPPSNHTEKLMMGIIDAMTVFIDLSDTNLEELADKFFNIDRTALENDRRAILKAARV